MKIALKNEPVQDRGFLDPRLAGVLITRGIHCTIANNQESSRWRCKVTAYLAE